MLSNSRKNEHGSISLYISVELDYTKTVLKKGEEITVKVHKDARLGIDPKFMNFESSHTDVFSKIVECQKSGNGLMRQVKKLLGAGQWLAVNIMTSGYEDVEEFTEYTQFGPHKSTCNQLFFNCWKYEGNGLADDDGADLGAEGGLHLEADPRYTEETHDIWMPWGQDILKTLEEAGI